MTGGGQKVQCLYHIMDKKSIFQNHCDDNANGEVEWLVNFEGLKLLCEYFRVAFPYLIYVILNSKTSHTREIELRDHQFLHRPQSEIWSKIYGALENHSQWVK